MIGASRFSVSLAALVLLGCAPEPKPAAKALESPPEVVATFPASAELSFGLAPGKCADAKCAAVVQLLANGKVIDSSPLDFAASDAQLNKGTADKLMGAGDPLQGEDALAAWTAGDGERAVATAVRPMKLSSERTALLVDQLAGFEHVKRRHYLYVADNKKLKRIWTGEESAGPAWSAAILVNAADGRSQEMVYLSGFQPGSTEPDAVGAKRYAWDAAQENLAERPLGGLYAIIAGDFANPEAARKAGGGTCLAEYSALPARALGIPGARIVLAVVSTQKSLAEAALNRTDNCPGKVARRVVEVNLAARQP